MFDEEISTNATAPTRASPAESPAGMAARLPQAKASAWHHLLALRRHNCDASSGFHLRSVCAEQTQRAEAFQKSVAAAERSVGESQTVLTNPDALRSEARPNAVLFIGTSPDPPYKLQLGVVVVTVFGAAFG